MQSAGCWRGARRSGPTGVDAVLAAWPATASSALLRTQDGQRRPRHALLRVPSSPLSPTSRTLSATIACIGIIPSDCGQTDSDPPSSRVLADCTAAQHASLVEHCCTPARRTSARSHAESADCSLLLRWRSDVSRVPAGTASPSVVAADGCSVRRHCSACKPQDRLLGPAAHEHGQLRPSARSSSRPTWSTHSPSLRFCVARGTLFAQSATFHAFSSSFSQPRWRACACATSQRYSTGVSSVPCSAHDLAGHCSQKPWRKQTRAAAQVLGVRGAQLAQAGEALRASRSGTRSGRRR